ncbi:MAG: response regulator transcription factor [Bacteroidia bacterium]|nr:response regulator transcription factor [Bacteroidia bacterium]MCC7533364.1 response regulator transcription factor [Bacteroidia bacterium]MCZ2140340.1 response regulator transcription factor [Bacteroidia bacterium]
MTKKILVTEDEDLIRKALEFRLKKEGYEVVSAMDGRIALQAIENTKFDLVITDLMLPFNSGMEIISKLKEISKETPIIVLTNIGLENVVMEAFNLGADDYMTKPFSPNELSVRVKRLLNK